jgi:hypothetical protein
MAYEFNGTNQYISRATAPVTVTPLTLACWFNPDLFHTGALCAVDSTAPSNWFALFVFNTGKVAASAVASGNGSSAVTTANYSTGSWNHCCGVFSSSTSRTIYLDGANSVTNTESRTPAGLNETVIGARRFLGAISAFSDSRIAEVGIWNAALTAEEVASLAKGMTCDKVRPESLVFYAPLVRDLQDISGGLTITNNNAATVATHPRVYA